MFKSITKLLGAGESKKIKRLEAIVEQINELESGYLAMSDDDLKKTMPEFKNRYENGETLEDLLPEVFAVIREASKRTLKMRHFDVQLMGGIVLFEGNISEMKTGEGKTLVATLPVILNSISEKSCHIVTVNDYLAKRDSEWMGPLYDYLGVTVGLIQQDINPDQRIEAYKADVTLGTNSEFGFDYLRDNMVVDISEKVQRDHNFAIVDEVDSILIDEARTPLIISGAPWSASDFYKVVDKAVSSMKLKKLPREPITPEEKEADAAYEEEYDYIAYEKDKHAKETYAGQEKIAQVFGYPVEELFGGDTEQIQEKLSMEELFKRDLIKNIFKQSMTAHALFQKDKDYVKKDGEILIVDEFTGRLMQGRRYSEGLHQAIEAKENVKIQQENQTLATITLQNYFRMYDKLAGMTGTAATEADEFMHIYKLDTIVIPPNKPIVREDTADVIYKTQEAKFNAVADAIKDCYEKGQPVLIGTVSIEKNELLSRLLNRRGIKHELLNAKNHAREAEIIAQAGRKGAVTVATNMAGRGVDIVLGGNPADKEEAQEVKELGGLHVIGTERHESRRIDNQLRGRSGRQGDPGSTQFYLSTEDELMRLFAGDKIKKIMETFNLPEDQPIEHGMISKSIENAQRQVESLNFSRRKSVLEYDDVMNKQREVIYEERNKILKGEDIDKMIAQFVDEAVEKNISQYANPDAHSEEWDIEGLINSVKIIAPIQLDKEEIENEQNYYDLVEQIKKKATDKLEKKNNELGELKEDFTKNILLSVVDDNWKNHLHSLDYIQEGVQMRAVGHRDPLVEFKSEAFSMFQALIDDIKEQGLHYFFYSEIVQEAQSLLEGASYASTETESNSGTTTTVQSSKIGRNEPCPCGSGKKYKKCCGA